MRWIAVLSFTCSAASCGEEEATVSPEEAAGRTIASKQRVLKTAQHNLHMNLDEPMQCEDCHELVSNEYLPAKSYRCGECHAEHKLILHSAASRESKADECHTCHGFAGESKEPTPCIECHKDQLGDFRAILPHDPEKPDEKCGECHRAHEEPSLQTSKCEGCHDTEEVSGHEDPEIEITGCGSCHGYHEKAATASERCTNCHRQSRGHAIPKAATFKDGHEKCVTCHKQHRFLKPEVVACTAECHEDQYVFGQGKVKEHGECLSCHNQHDALASARNSCAECHEKQAKVKHPEDDDTKTACLGCHKPHAGRGMPLAIPCSECHNVARSDTWNHQGKANAPPRCRDCHRPHGFNIKGAGADLCKSCHVSGSFKSAPSVRPRKGHHECVKCHTKDVAHKATAEKVACTTCHEEKKKNVKGHMRCPDCHEPHSAVRRKLCNECHGDEAASVPNGHEDCGLCHEPHIPRVKKACEDCHDDKSGQKLHK